jgi:hypothetical protein
VMLTTQYPCISRFDLSWEPRLSCKYARPLGRLITSNTSQLIEPLKLNTSRMRLAKSQQPGCSKLRAVHRLTRRCLFRLPLDMHAPSMQETLTTILLCASQFRLPYAMRCSKTELEQPVRWLESVQLSVSRSAALLTAWRLPRTYCS